MTTAVALRFPWGRYHANPWGRHLNEAATDWPPSPWRLLRALYATWQCRAPHLDAGAVHALLTELSSPPQYVVPPYTEAQTRHYFPRLSHMRGRPKWGPTTDYSDDAKDKAIDAFVVCDPSSDLVVVWNVDLAEACRAALGELVQLLPHVGRAESICEARLVDRDALLPGEVNCSLIGDEVASDDPRSRMTRLLVPESPLDVEALTLRPVDVRRRRFLDPPSTRWQRYELPGPEVTTRPSKRRTQREPALAVRFALHAPAPPSRQAAVAVGDILRQACMSRYGHRNDGGVSAVLAGKDERGEKLRRHQHAHYLSFSSQPGNPLLEHVVVWAPGGLGEHELDALETVRELRGYGFARDFRECRLGLEAIGAMRSVAPELVGPSRRWRSFTPFAPARHRKRRISRLEHVDIEVRRELQYRDFKEEPVHVSLVRRDWLSFRRYRPTKERLEDARNAFGVEIEFKHPVEGPIALGALSHFGLGLFLPCP